MEYATKTELYEQSEFEHGVDSGYYRHRKRGETPCTECRKAHNKVTKDNMVKRELRNKVVLPKKLFAALYWTANTDTINKLDTYFGPETLDQLIKEADGPF